MFSLLWAASEKVFTLLMKKIATKYVCQQRVPFPYKLMLSSANLNQVSFTQAPGVGREDQLHGRADLRKCLETSTANRRGQNVEKHRVKLVESSPGGEA